MQILKKRITYKNKPYIVIINEYLNINEIYYEVKVKKPYYIRCEYNTIFDIGKSYMEMIEIAMKEYVKEKEKIDNELLEINKIKEWDGVIK